MFTLSGSVVDTGGKGIAGVVVNNGCNFTVTDDRGRWMLLTDTFASKFVSISTPAAYRLPRSGSMAAGFFVPVAEAARGRGCRFVLEPRAERADSFYYVAVSDPQVRGAADMARWRNETLAGLRPVADSLADRREVVGVALGDIVFDNPAMFGDYAASLAGLPLTMFQCIGNHDADSRQPGLVHARPGAARYAELAFHRAFGPTAYSFNIGRAHVVTLANIDWLGGGRYVERLTDAQLRWLERDLSYVRPGSLVILNIHAPGWNREGAAANMKDAARLERALKGYRAHVFCGHTHFFQNVEVGPGLYQHNIGAASGAWWEGGANRCGAPRGYMVASVCGDSVAWEYLPSRQSQGRMRVCAHGGQAGRQAEVVANVWDCDSRTRVEWLREGRPMGRMERFVGVDSCCGVAAASLVPTSHLFRCRPRGRWREVAVVATDRFGRRTVATVRP